MKVNRFASSHSTRVPKVRHGPYIPGLGVPAPRSAVTGWGGAQCIQAGVRNTRNETKPRATLTVMYARYPGWLSDWDKKCA